MYLAEYGCHRSVHWHLRVRVGSGGSPAPRRPSSPHSLAASRVKKTSPLPSLHFPRVGLVLFLSISTPPLYQWKEEPATCGRAREGVGRFGCVIFFLFEEEGGPRLATCGQQRRVALRHQKSVYSIFRFFFAQLGSCLCVPDLIYLTHLLIYFVFCVSQFNLGIRVFLILLEVVIGLILKQRGESSGFEPEFRYSEFRPNHPPPNSDTLTVMCVSKLFFIDIFLLVLNLFLDTNNIGIYFL